MIKRKLSTDIPQQTNEFRFPATDLIGVKLEGLHLKQTFMRNIITLELNVNQANIGENSIMSQC